LSARGRRRYDGPRSAPAPYGNACSCTQPKGGECSMSIVTILIIVVIVLLVLAFFGRGRF
jgi:hypothetical protein